MALVPQEYIDFQQCYRKLSSLCTEDILSLPRQVCDGSPWVSARPVFVLTLGQGNEETGVMYTLRTSVPSPDTEDELAKVRSQQLRQTVTHCLLCKNLYSWHRAPHAQIQSMWRILKSSQTDLDSIITMG